MLYREKIEELINIIQDCNINFLIGSGLSSPFLSVLGNIEILLTEIDKLDLSIEKKSIAKASIYKKYFDTVILGNLEILSGSLKCKTELDNYKNFLGNLFNLITKRKNTLLSKQINIFTTNIDIFIEKASEDLQIDCNDGFKGRFNPIYEISDFKKSYFKRSLQYENSSEIPVINLIKLHGSVTWMLKEGRIYFFELKQIKVINDIQIIDKVISFNSDSSVDTIKNELNLLNDKPSEEINNFIKLYEELAIINPTKQKFAQTILDETYYELLRLYSNELEKENSVLFVLGFSMSDEHIRNLTIRSAKSNPTLKIFIICYNLESKIIIEKNIKNYSEITLKNIEYISTDTLEAKDDKGNLNENDVFKLNLKNINDKILGPIIKKISLVK